MRSSLQKLNVPFKEVFFIFFGVSFVGMVLVVLLLGNLPPVVPLLYGLPKGEDQLVPKIALIVPLLIAQVITVINMVLVKHTKDHFSQRALVYLVVAVNSLAIITVVKIVLLVGSF